MTISTLYHIRIRGHLDPSRADWFEGMTITLEHDFETLIAGRVPDQAALHGLLAKVRDLGVILVSVCRVETGN